MLTSIAVIFLSGLLLSYVFRILRLPGLLGMIITGMLLGPNGLRLLDSSILSISADLRQLALVIILTRAGLSLDLKELKRVGRPAVLMCFIPACFEILGVVLMAPALLGVSIVEAAVMGAVLGAVSPAVIVPKMLKIIYHVHVSGGWRRCQCGRICADSGIHCNRYCPWYSCWNSFVCFF